ncbi:MAG: LuxR family transcriptional regulator [Candidatus Kapabacteria bacterium]|nr:LuxR family transcriptional regulator [Candidatus Kapabacteria bacterium]
MESDVTLILDHATALLHNDPASCISYLQSQVAQPLLHDEHHMMKAQELLANCSMLLGNIDEAATRYKVLIEYYEREGMPIEHVRMSLYYGRILTSKGQYDETLLLLGKMLDMLSTLNKTRTLEYAFLLSDIGSIYAQLGDYTLALRYYEQAFDCSKHIGAKQQTPLFLCNMASAQYEMNNLADAEQYYLQAQTYAIRQNEQTWMIFVNIGLAKVYLKKKKKTELINPYIVAAETIGGTLKNPIQRADVFTEIAELYVEAANPEKATEAGEIALYAAKPIGLLPHTVRIHKLLATLYEHNGDFKAALHQQKSYIDTYTRLYNNTRQRETSRQLAQFQVERLLAENTQLKHRIIELDDICSLQTQEMKKLTLQVAERSEFIASIHKELRRMGKSPEAETATNTTVQHRVQKLISNSGMLDRTWEGQIHDVDNHEKEFMIKLKDLHPNFSSTELRICSLLRMSMSTKQICGILHITPRAVENHRSRIRKKLNLPLSQNLMFYLATL